uniref:Uncharacterized protein n=1 Tax=Oryza sativa subsp. japonica TaxID=39947 RepID=Q6Z8V0_ORYSJ|nr:hypothetical protein [Oryza sativa Japonica Group]BAD10001.1 hypothetical protein [Oryza sativa Japonica Group]
MEHLIKSCPQAHHHSCTPTASIDALLHYSECSGNKACLHRRWPPCLYASPLHELTSTVGRGRHNIANRVRHSFYTTGHRASTSPAVQAHHHRCRNVASRGSQSELIPFLPNASQPNTLAVIDSVPAPNTLEMLTFRANTLRPTFFKESHCGPSTW